MSRPDITSQHFGYRAEVEVCMSPKHRSRHTSFSGGKGLQDGVVIVTDFETSSVEKLVEKDKQTDT
jgi:hypothetical protein